MKLTSQSTVNVIKNKQKKLKRVNENTIHYYYNNYCIYYTVEYECIKVIKETKIKNQSNDT